MRKPFLTVIIPTYNRSQFLDECLRHLSKQTLKKKEYEIIVVDDGSKDDTKKILTKWSKICSNLTSHYQKNSGQGNARNRALKNAKGEVILFIGDDIYGQKDFLEIHVKFHRKHKQNNFSCLGQTIWDPRKPITDYMKWLTHGGPQFAYHKLKSGEEAGFWFFYTSNISLKTKLLEKETFNSKYRGYGWEDIELAYRLKKTGDLKIIYEDGALAFHDHFMESSSLKDRMKSIGRNSHIFEETHPEIKIIPKGIKKLAIKTMIFLPFIWMSKLISKRLHWYLLSKRYFMMGVRSV